MKKVKILIICLVLPGFILGSIRYIDNKPYSVILKDEKGLVNCDFQKVIIKNRYGKTLAKGKHEINPKTQEIEDNKLSYKVENEVLYIETLYFGGIVSYDYETRSFDYSKFEESVEILEPDGEVSFKDSNYYGGMEVKFKL